MWPKSWNAILSTYSSVQLAARSILPPPSAPHPLNQHPPTHPPSATSLAFTQKFSHLRLSENIYHLTFQFKFLLLRSACDLCRFSDRTNQSLLKKTTTRKQTRRKKIEDLPIIYFVSFQCNLILFSSGQLLVWFWNGSPNLEYFKVFHIWKRFFGFGCKIRPMNEF